MVAIDAGVWCLSCARFQIIASDTSCFFLPSCGSSRSLSRCDSRSRSCAQNLSKPGNMVQGAPELILDRARMVWQFKFQNFDTEYQAEVVQHLDLSRCLDALSCPATFLDSVRFAESRPGERMLLFECALTFLNVTSMAYLAS